VKSLGVILDDFTTVHYLVFLIVAVSGGGVNPIHTLGFGFTPRVGGGFMGDLRD